MKTVGNLKGKLIVSCQALDDEPLHSSFIMGRMAAAAKQGGASGIRANSVEDIKEIKKTVDLPVVGIIKKSFADSSVFITPTINEVNELIGIGAEIISTDATNRIRPGNINLDDFFTQIKNKYPNQLLFADCSTVDEILHADELGFDFVSSTLVGYTEYTSGTKIETNDFELLRTVLPRVKAKVIAEGNINTPEKAKRVMELGCYGVVVGSAITRPQLITKKFVEAVDFAQG